jgi:hypothetical protein
MGDSVPVITACSGFLIAVLWIDLIFDVQVLPHRHEVELPESVLASIAGYYHRATTTSRPMNHLIAGVMVILVATLVLRVVDGRDPTWLVLVAVPLAVGPILLALERTVPNAVRLGRQVGTTAEQTRRARAVCVDHLLCIACQVVFAGVWLASAAT